MNNLERDLEQSFLKLPTLNHVGMALLQFTRHLSNTGLQKKTPGIFIFGFAGFSFPAGKETIRLHVNLERKSVDPGDMQCLPLEFGEEFLTADITFIGQLGAAIRYIEIALHKPAAIPTSSSNLHVLT